MPRVTRSREWLDRRGAFTEELLRHLLLILIVFPLILVGAMMLRGSKCLDDLKRR
jgi:hypothetical protein